VYGFASFSRVRTLPKPAESPARFTGDCALLLVATSSGYWSETADGTVNKPRTEAAGALYSWSQESIKLVERWLPAAAAPFGLGLELTRPGTASRAPASRSPTTACRAA
jgi:hypothetical protein